MSQQNGSTGKAVYVQSNDADANEKRSRPAAAALANRTVLPELDRPQPGRPALARRQRGQ
jgi:hypothetical protein